jgi:hypothetical protein
MVLIKALRTENSSRKMQGLPCDPPKLRFENPTNKKTLKQAWRFFLIELFIRDLGRIF